MKNRGNTDERRRRPEAPPGEFPPHDSMIPRRNPWGGESEAFRHGMGWRTVDANLAGFPVSPCRAEPAALGTPRDRLEAVVRLPQGVQRPGFGGSRAAPTRLQDRRRRIEGELAERRFRIPRRRGTPPIAPAIQ